MSIPRPLTHTGKNIYWKMLVWVVWLELFRVWPRTLTTYRHVRSNIISPFKSTYMTSYLTSIDTFSLSRTVPEIFDFKLFRVRKWFSTLNLTLESHVMSKIYSPFEIQYMTSYLTSIDTFSLSRTDSPILRYLTPKFLGFDLDLWPIMWPLKVAWGRKCVRHMKAHTWLPI